ncbi:MAG: hypothetical protein K9G46_04860 [Flavobacteriales bacterium]|nr:hypothetical protein [Flavobacteriales bacterium]
MKKRSSSSVEAFNQAMMNASSRFARDFDDYGLANIHTDIRISLHTDGTFI